MAKFTAPSGAVCEATLHDYDTTWDLFMAVINAAREGGIASKLPKNFDPSKTDIMSMELADLGGFIDIFIDILKSKEVKESLFKCMEKATYNDTKMTRDTFEDEKARGDFLTVAWEVGKLNVSPFTKNLSSLLKAIMG